MGKLTNKTAFITGGTSGIGLATAQDFINEGARVIITGRHSETLNQTVASLGPNAFSIACDNGKMSDILQLPERIKAITPALDIVFANAGYGRFAPVGGVTEAMFDELFNVLVKGTFFTVQQLLPLLREGSSIIFNTSVVTAYGSQNASIYSAAKAAVQSLTKNLAADLTAQKIRVNSVSPGYTETDIFNKTGFTAEQITGAKDYITPLLPYKRFGTAMEVAKAVSFLASDDASYIHGAEIVVDGGYSVIR
ncbi:SDR family oxidoreductase [Parachryseolinea silvisoli]|uniref:SDR family oxidoreductase n=1 Tax=Parachryseolinea silvisoli TaxID=2873601 RepID=UPI002265E3D7|nr:SDR family oxidoreductase [Parachryseolinea silvisoli]MCD9018892.1 SDR family oxidoreductase [Parachryseolinea silvisoli]